MNVLDKVDEVHIGLDVMASSLNAGVGGLLTGANEREPLAYSRLDIMCEVGDQVVDLA